MHSRLSHVHQALASLAPPRRFELLLLVLSGVDRSVSQLASAVRLSQSCTTRHLQALARAGLVKGVRDGKRVVFRPAPRDPAAAGVLASLADPAGPFAAPRPPASRRRSRRLAAGAPSPAGGSGPRRRKASAGTRGRPRRRRAPPADPTRAASSAQRREAPFAAPEATAPRTEPESGKNTAPPSASPRAWQELEDYLL